MEMLTPRTTQAGTAQQPMQPGVAPQQPSSAQAVQTADASDDLPF